MGATSSRGIDALAEQALGRLVAIDQRLRLVGETLHRIATTLERIDCRLAGEPTPTELRDLDEAVREEAAREG